LTLAAPLGPDQIAALVPHQGTMCLLARVDAWDAQGIVCHATNHRDPEHPLRTRSGLLSSCLIEYAAQAMALHGALRGGAAASAARPGLLAAARQVRLGLLKLDDLPRLHPDELRIEATCQAADERQLLYGFTARHGATQLASGRITVVLQPQGHRA
jgi:predicted hotdog family 3-hydroxylacyl-ACP dehydratase